MEIKRVERRPTLEVLAERQREVFDLLNDEVKALFVTKYYVDAHTDNGFCIGLGEEGTPEFEEKLAEIKARNVPFTLHERCNADLPWHTFKTAKDPVKVGDRVRGSVMKNHNDCCIGVVIAMKKKPVVKWDHLDEPKNWTTYLL